MRIALARAADLIDESDDEFVVEMTGHARSLKAYARRLTRDNRGDADDLLQDALLRCWAARHRFELGTNFLAWARTVMRNIFLSDRRRDRFHADLPEDAFERLLGVTDTQGLTVDLRDVRWALGELTPEHREAVLLASEGLSIEEGAAQLAIPEGTFKSRVWRGRLRLRQLTENRDTPLLPLKHIGAKPREVTRPRRDWTGVTIG
ncbi:RNA polymerase subunit sigma-24 [Sphingomonas sp. T1]|uniref:sigma-70 family RNA polymerase sigma factor n=1 Tax=Sphingomonas sp. T1 TaxID=2653172 RepID=UPI0012F3FCCD|nr:sigma-70 family RNA polymerase sigma factor [Sphingomonas sp. T1]VXD05798.1 RNA polymerase subunit sigma-24 [Sphingomonas sp. T1]